MLFDSRSFSQEHKLGTTLLSISSTLTRPEYLFFKMKFLSVSGRPFIRQPKPAYLSNLCVKGAESLSAIPSLNTKSYMQSSHIIVIAWRLIC